MIENKMVLTNDADFRPCRPELELPSTLTLEALQAAYDDMNCPTKGSQPFMVVEKHLLMGKCQRWGIEYKDDFVYKGVRYIESRPLPIKEPI